MPPHRGGFDPVGSSPTLTFLSLVFGQYTVLIGLGIFFVLAFVGIFVYFKTYGYTIQMGWDRIVNVFKNKDQVNITATEDGNPEAALALIPPVQETTEGRDAKSIKSMLGFKEGSEGSSGGSGSGSSGGSGSGSSGSSGGSGSSPGGGSGNMAADAAQGAAAAMGLPFSPEDRPSGMPGAEEKPGFVSRTVRSLKKAFGPDEQVFNLNRNIYTYDEAAPVCKAMGAELATFEQVEMAQKHGADWCNYGWVKGQMAVFPTSEETWNKLQTGPKEYRFSCGKPGVNGGHFDNPELRFGVNCFGGRPQKKDADELLFDSDAGMPPTAEQVEFDKKVQKFRDQMENITVLPWSREKWSG